MNAIEIQDKVFLGGEYQNNVYKTPKKNAFIIGVNCSKAAENCFCTSMNSGPEIKNGYDLLLTEIHESNKHYFIIEAGSDEGNDLLNELRTADVSQNDIEAKNRVIQSTISQIEKRLDTQNLKEILLKNIESPVWDEVAKRCLACGNCTIVYPTCFCMTVED